MAEGGVIGVEGLNEFTNVARRQLAWNWEQIEAALLVIQDRGRRTFLAESNGFVLRGPRIQWVASASDRLDRGVSN